MPYSSNALGTFTLVVSMSLLAGCVMAGVLNEWRLWTKKGLAIVATVGLLLGILLPLCNHSAPLFPSEANLLAAPASYMDYVKENESKIPLSIRVSYALKLYTIRSAEATEMARKMASGIMLTAADAQAQAVLQGMAHTAVAEQGVVDPQDLRRIAKLLIDQHDAEVANQSR